MDAVLFLKEKHRVCKTELCVKCKLSSNNNGAGIPCESYIAKHPEKAVAIVEKWSNENPLKTNKDKFFEMFPKAPKDNNGYPPILVCDLGWCGTVCSNCKYDTQTSTFCWDLPYEGDD
jgi:hypothetical protein